MSKKIVTYQQFRYRLLNDTEAELIDASVAKGHVVIPETIVADGKKYTVTSISSYKLPHMSREAKADKRTNTGYKFEEKGIKEYEFSPFSKWKPSSYYPGTFDWYERHENEAITEITLPKTLKHVKRFSFYGIRGMKPSKDYKYDYYAHLNGWSAGNPSGNQISIILPEGVEDIESDACGYDVIELHIPSTVKKVPAAVIFFDSGYFGEKREPIIETAETTGTTPAFLQNGPYKIIIHNDEGYVNVSPANWRVEYVGKPKVSSSSKSTTKKAAEKDAPTKTSLASKLQKTSTTDNAKPKTEPKPAAKKPANAADKEGRQMWVERSSEQLVSLGEKMLNIVNSAAASKYELRYTNSYIGFGANGKPSNFAWFIPKKKEIQVNIKVKQDQDLDKTLNNKFAGNWAYKGGTYSVNLSGDIEALQAMLLNAEQQFKK